jgi:hypothetical protein
MVKRQIDASCLDYGKTLDLFAWENFVRPQQIQTFAKTTVSHLRIRENYFTPTRVITAERYDLPKPAAGAIVIFEVTDPKIDFIRTAVAFALAIANFESPAETTVAAVWPTIDRVTGVCMPATSFLIRLDSFVEITEELGANATINELDARVAGLGSHWNVF